MHWLVIKRRRPNLGLYPLSNYVLVKGLPWGAHEVSFFAGASPAVANGDIANVPYVTAPDNFILTLTSTGVPVIQVNGSTARQIVLLDVYDMSLRRWFGRVTDYVNDQPPVMLDLTHYQIPYIVGVPIINLDLSTFVTDPNGDQVTITTQSPLPPGLTIAANVLTGTPSQLGTFPVTFYAGDNIGPNTAFPPWTFTIQPDVVDQPFPATAFLPQPLDVYTGADTLTLMGVWTADSTQITADGSFAGAPPAGGKYIWTADGGMFLEIPTWNAALLAWPPVQGATAYNVYQNGVLLASINTLLYTAQGLAYDTTYEFAVTATVGAVEYQNGHRTLRFSSTDPIVTPMTRKIPFPSVGWN